VERALERQQSLGKAVGRRCRHADRRQGSKGRTCRQRTWPSNDQTLVVCRFICFGWGRRLLRMNRKRTLAGLDRPISSRAGQSTRLRTRLSYHIRCISVSLVWGLNRVWLRCAAQKYRTTQGF
jgi:hypothetical protein